MKNIKEREELAALLFAAPQGGPAADAAYWEAHYPGRALPGGAVVTRLGPSPTGFVHLGNLFMATINRRLARQSGGVFYLRIEDTDQKREVEGAVPTLIESLAYFGIDFDEGVRLENGAAAEHGSYGPYFQSARRAIYHAFARKLLLEGKAYPCFLTEEEITQIREEQERNKRLPGIYGTYAKWRNAEFEEVEKRIRAGEPWVLRLDADAAWEAGETVPFTDGIRGGITFPRNVLDVVILKADGLPTYHFAHAVDDHLMGTTQVVRGEEWLSSVPIHLMLFAALGFAAPAYCHTALLMKIDEETGVKRKLSKRSDPELALSYYISEGYHPKAMEEYLLTVLNSNYEEWRLANPGADNEDFTVTTEKMGVSGILFDLQKLEDVSRDTLLTLPSKELAEFMIGWARARDAEDGTEIADVYTVQRDTLEKALDVGRGGEKPRKDLAYARQIAAFIGYFFDEFFRMEDPLPENIPEAEAEALLKDYLASYDHSDDRDMWFEKIRGIAEAHGYAPKPKDYKKEPERWKGHVGDVSAVIRRALTGRLNAPDIWEIQQILGERRVRERLTPRTA
ncbi:MAG: glutamate--tRNA ligase [Clostridiales bacterium]|nr:glutamate--tRNA ligase [Clostridiales bacterium]